MNKESFLKKLRKRLSILEDSEIEDIVSEYEGYIDEKVSLGLTEEEAVKELGDFEEIVSDLLSAYKLKGTNKEENYFNNILNKIGGFFDRFMDSLDDKSGRDIIRILIEVVLILFLICLLKIPFAMIRDLGADIFEELVRPIGYVFASIWSFIIEISYIVVAVIFFIKMFEKRCFKELSENITAKREQEEAYEPKKEKRKVNREEKKKEVVKESKRNHGFSDTLTDICIYILKFFAIMILIGIVFYLVGMSVALGFIIYLLAKGVTYFGIYLLIFVLFLGGVLFLELCINFIFNKRTKALPFFTKLITLIILTGISLTISAVEIADTEIIYGNKNVPTKTVTKEIDMTKDLYLHNYTKVVIDNNLKDRVKVEYVYPDAYNDTEIEINLNHCGSGYCLNTNVIHATWNKEFLKNFIDNLKDKKIYAYDFHIEKVIYLSEENYKTIEENARDYHYYGEDNETLYTFEGNYNILNIAESNDPNYLYFTIKDHFEGNIETVKVPRSIMGNIKETGSYTFTFECSIERPNNIKGAFDKCKIINIVSENE